MLTYLGVINIDSMDIDDISYNESYIEYINLKIDINIAKKKLDIRKISNTDDARLIANYINNMEINMKKEINTCNLCKKRDKCKQLCSDMIEKLKNKKNNNDMYSDKTVNIYNSFDLSNIVYTYGLSKIEERDTKRIMIAILKKEQKEILYLLSQGYTQKDIAKKLKVSQSNISQKLEAIKRELKDSLVKIMPYIL